MARYALPVVALIVAPLAFSQESTLEEVVVTSSFTHQVQGQNESSVAVISGTNITENFTQSLGEHLSTIAGVSSNNFGPAVGQPVIRGLSNNRVKVLQNNLVVRDVAGIGPDHPIDLDLGNIEQVEIVRGAAALLHSNGASGGIINVVDNTIAKSDIEEPLFTLSAEQQTGNEGEGFSTAFKRNIGGFNVSYSFTGFDAQDYEVPNGAVLHEEEEHDDHDDHDEDHEGEEHDEDHEEDMGTLANSDYETKAHRFGISKTGEWGFLGASYQDISYTYGIPFHGEHADHDEEGHGEDHDDDHEGEEHDDDHEGEEHHDEHEGERIVSQTDSEVFTIEGLLNVNNALLNSVQFSVRDTDYTLFEQHAEGEHEGEHEDEHEGHSEEPTYFLNDSTEVQMIFNLGSAENPRRVVVNQVSEKVAVLGEEAFMEPVKSTETTIGAFGGFDVSGFDIDVGIRYDDIERKGTIREMHEEEEHEEEGHEEEGHDEEEHHDEHEGFELEPFTFKDQSVSGVITIGRSLTDSLSGSVNLGFVTRTPSAMELFMNGEHLAVARYEVGDANLKPEESNNIDFNLFYNDETWFASASIYRNTIDNYIYLRDESEEEHEEHEEEGHEGEHEEHGGLLLAEYMQADATFSGYEIEIGRRFNIAGGELEVRLHRDQVKADFSAGGNVPRITPSRNVFAMDYSRGMTRAMVEVQDVGSQNTISSFETPTADYRLVNGRLSHSIDVGDGAMLTISAFGRNLTNEIARSHTSFVKDEVPLAGRNIGIKASLSF
ncbi:MAG: TonB-dependent receptor [Pseudomonadota bacterium]|nr:TonB-dependent receptor [Pseudomonadota bacterium]